MPTVATLTRLLEQARNHKDVLELEVALGEASAFTCSHPSGWSSGAGYRSRGASGTRGGSSPPSDTLGSFQSLVRDVRHLYDSVFQKCERYVMPLRRACHKMDEQEIFTALLKCQQASPALQLSMYSDMRDAVALRQRLIAIHGEAVHVLDSPQREGDIEKFLEENASFLPERTVAALMRKSKDNKPASSFHAWRADVSPGSGSRWRDPLRYQGGPYRSLSLGSSGHSRADSAAERSHSLGNRHPRRASEDTAGSRDGREASRTRSHRFTYSRESNHQWDKEERTHALSLPHTPRRSHYRTGGGSAAGRMPRSQACDTDRLVEEEKQEQEKEGRARGKREKTDRAVVRHDRHVWDDEDPYYYRRKSLTSSPCRVLPIGGIVYRGGAPAPAPPTTGSLGRTRGDGYAPYYSEGGNVKTAEKRGEWPSWQEVSRHSSGIPNPKSASWGRRERGNTDGADRLNGGLDESQDRSHLPSERQRRAGLEAPSRGRGDHPPHGHRYGRPAAVPSRHYYFNEGDPYVMNDASASDEGGASATDSYREDIPTATATGVVGNRGGGTLQGQSGEVEEEDKRKAQGGGAHVDPRDEDALYRQEGGEEEQDEADDKVVPIEGEDEEQEEREKEKEERHLKEDEDPDTALGQEPGVPLTRWNAREDDEEEKNDELSAVRHPPYSGTAPAASLLQERSSPWKQPLRQHERRKLLLFMEKEESAREAVEAAERMASRRIFEQAMEELAALWCAPFAVHHSARGGSLTPRREHQAMTSRRAKREEGDNAVAQEDWEGGRDYDHRPATPIRDARWRPSRLGEDEEVEEDVEDEAEAETEARDTMDSREYREYPSHRISSGTQDHLYKVTPTRSDRFHYLTQREEEALRLRRSRTQGDSGREGRRREQERPVGMSSVPKEDHFSAEKEGEEVLEPRRSRGASHHTSGSGPIRTGSLTAEAAGASSRWSSSLRSASMGRVDVQRIRLEARLRAVLTEEDISRRDIEGAEEFERTVNLFPMEAKTTALLSADRGGRGGEYWDNEEEEEWMEEESDMEDIWR